MKLIRIYIILLALTTLTATYTVTAQDTGGVAADNGYTSQTRTEDKPADTGMTVTGIAMVAIGIVIIGTGIYYMVRNRRRTLGGIQSQDKGEPTPRTTDSIDNPGSGV